MMVGETVRMGLKMGEYGAYVWSSYGLTLLALLYLALTVRRSWRIELQQARRRVQAAAISREQQS